MSEQWLPFAHRWVPLTAVHKRNKFTFFSSYFFVQPRYILLGPNACIKMFGIHWILKIICIHISLTNAKENIHGIYIVIFVIVGLNNISEILHIKWWNYRVQYKKEIVKPLNFSDALRSASTSTKAIGKLVSHFAVSTESFVQKEKKKQHNNKRNTKK